MNDEAKKAKAEKLLNALSDTDDEMIIAASQQKKSAKRRLPLWCGIGAAAVLAVGGIAAGVILNRNPGELLPPDNIVGTLTADENLPKISASYTVDGMGFEGVMVPDISEYAMGNPWTTDWQLGVMPVYKNRVKHDPGLYVITDIDCETVTNELRALLIEYASRMGVTLTESDITDDGFAKEDWEKIAESYEAAKREPVPGGYFIPRIFKAETDDFKISTDNTYMTTIEFNEPIKLPESLNATGFDKASDVANYLMEEYSGLLGMTAPKISIDGGDYTYSGEKTDYNISFYESDGTPEERVENYFMNYATFYRNEEGDLWIIRLFRYDLAAELVGNYPLITPEEAGEMLKNGEYATSAPVAEDWKPEDYGRVELVYRTGYRDDYFLPYYKFWVDISDELPGESGADNNGNLTYGAFYVPAVQPQYIEDVSTYDGSFN